MNIVGIGTDMVSIARIKAIWERFGAAFARRILSPVELEGFSQARNPIAFLAKRYAAKEAVAKALGTGFRPQSVLLSDIRVHNDRLGCPYLEYSGQTAIIMAEKGVVNSHLSLSDEKEFALAFVILVGL